MFPAPKILLLVRATMSRRTMFTFLCILSCTTSLILGTPIEDNSYELNKGIQHTLENFNEVIEEAADLPVDLIGNAGYHSEVHHVVTEDNYILELHRIPGSKQESNLGKKPVVFMMHGLLETSAAWILSNPEQSLAFLLVEEGYDVWLGNFRGTRYSRKHIGLTTEDKDYWQFSWHELGVQDLPAMIDYVLQETEQNKLFYVGHSQGTTTFFVMASERPEYQEKIEAMFALAPVTYSSRMFSPPFQILSSYANKIKLLTDLIGQHEFKPSDECMEKFMVAACKDDAILQPLCANVFFLLSGFNKDQMNTTLLSTIVQHVPGGASTMQFVHYAQLIKSGKFRQYDHGLFQNLKRYGRISPPDYNLGSIKVPVYLHYSTNDWLSHVRDVHQLYNELGNPIVKLRVPHERFNHIDFMWGIDANKLVYNKILNFMSHYKKN